MVLDSLVFGSWFLVLNLASFWFLFIASFSPDLGLSEQSQSCMNISAVTDSRQYIHKPRNQPGTNQIAEIQHIIIIII